MIYFVDTKTETVEVWLAIYIRSDISYVQKQYFSEEIENIFFEFFEILKPSQ